MDPIRHTIRSNMGAYSRTIRHNHSTMDHKTLRNRMDRTIRDTSMGCMPMCSNTMNCCTKGHNDGSSTMSFRYCMECSSTKGRCCSAMNMGFHRLSRPCWRVICHILCWLTCFPESLLYPSCPRKDISLTPWSLLPKRLSWTGIRLFRLLNGMKGRCYRCRPGIVLLCLKKHIERLCRMMRAG